MANRKRGQGENSIYRRASDGRWAGVISLGNQQRKYVYARTAELVREKLAQEKDRVKRSRKATDGRLTVEEVATAWLATKKLSIRPRSHERYAVYVNNHIIPAIGNERMAALTTVKLEMLLQKKQETLSPKTVRGLAAIMKALFSWAEKKGGASFDPARDIVWADLPEIEPREMTPLSSGQVRDLIAAARGTPGEALIIFLICSGARIGEALGLQWSNLDMDTGRVQIKRALDFRDGEAKLVAPKTRSAVRTVCLPPMAIAALKTHRVRQLESRVKMGRAWGDRLDLIFTTETGQPLNRHKALKWYLRPLLAKAGLPATFRLHDLRHEFASLMIHDGIPLTTISKVLGHSNAGITLTVYAKMLPGSEELTAAAMQRIVGAAAG